MTPEETVEVLELGLALALRLAKRALLMRRSTPEERERLREEGLQECLAFLDGMPARVEAEAAEFMRQAKAKAQGEAP